MAGMSEIRTAVGWLSDQLPMSTMREHSTKYHTILKFRVSTVTVSRVGSLLERSLTVMRDSLKNCDVQGWHRQVKPKIRVSKQQIADYEVTFRIKERANGTS